MDNTKLYAIIAVAVLVVAGVGAYLAFGGGSDEYRSTNTDGRLTILGNANEDDYLDDEDVKTLEEMISENKYTVMADANDDGVIDQKDIDMVKEIIDVKEYNKNKSDSDKKSMTVNYITVDGDVSSAKYPVSKMIILNTQRSLGLAIAIGAGDNVVGINDFIKSYWDKNLFKDYEGLPSVGDRKEPSIEDILKINADTVYSGTAKTYGLNLDGNTVGDKQILRLTTWENGRLAEGALMLGFFTDNDSGAHKYVKWVDDVIADLDEKLDKVQDKTATKFYLGTPTYMYAQSDGVSTAMSASGATNVGNVICTDPSKGGMSVSACLEDILDANPQYIVAGKYMYTHMTSTEVKEMYDTLDYSKFAITDGYKNGKISMVNYDLPFCIQTLIAAHIFFPDAVSMDDVEESIEYYLDNFCDTNGYEFDIDNFIYFPDGY